MRCPRPVWLAVLCVSLGCGSAPPAAERTSPPASLDELRTAVARRLERDRVPGAALALVRAGGIEWAGGIGLADRDAGSPVTEHTHFRVGSVSKTFVALALNRLYEEGALDLDAAVADLAPEVVIDNPFPASPVTVLHLLEHTAGFDDMHFNEMYNVLDPPDLPLASALRRNPASRRVRWRPGSRMSYSNPGYAVAGLIIEKVTGRRYEEVVRDRLLDPLGMSTSSFTLDPAERPLLARGYDAPAGPPVPLTPIYLRPAGNLHTSAAELARFVRMLLNWGELDGTQLIDPEYLSNMERPRSSDTARAGLIYGYGSGIVSASLAGFPVLGHSGGIEGFAATYGYSTARDVGWVVLLNASYAPQALNDIAALALRYLKRDVEPPAGPALPLSSDILGAYAGYYHPAGSRSALLEPLEWLAGGVRVDVDGAALSATPVFGRADRLVPVSEALFRRATDVTPGLAFLADSTGGMVMAGDGLYAIRRSRWPVEVVRGAVLSSVVLLATWPGALAIWLVRARRPLPRGFWGLKLALAVPLIGLLAMASLSLAPMRDWGVANGWTRAVFAGSWALPIGAALSLGLWTGACRQGAGRWFCRYAALLVAAAAIVATYAAWWRLVGLRLWTY